MIHSIHKPVNHLNWRNNEDFMLFLQFEFSLADAAPEVRKQVLTLIPIAVAEERLVGAIKETVLKAAITAWNRPELTYAFRRTHRRWRFLGETQYLSANEPFETVYGSLRRSLTPGSYCRAPHLEVIRKT